MTSVDANILLYGYCPESPYHAGARTFLEELSHRDDVAVSEFILAEFYLHLRNPAGLQRPLTASEAVAVIGSYRKPPRWNTLGFPPRSRALHDDLWHRAAHRDFARRRVCDTRVALCLTAFGVTDFATLNVEDFQGCGFTRVWNPLAA